jgi:phage/plasmid-like protein (TIGR03299 family)
MSANLATKLDGSYAFVSAKEPAWHGLGKVLKDAFTADVALKQGGLDFDVVKIQNQLETGLVIPDSFSLMRTDRIDNANGILGSCGKQYHIVQNEDLFSFFDFLVEDNHAIYQTAGALGNGERVWILARLPKDIVVGNDDVVNQYILVTNAHTGKHSALAMVTPVRVVCNNTLNMALKGKSNFVTIRHFKNATEKLQEAHKLLGFTTKYYDELSATYNKMQKKVVSDSDVTRWVKKILGTPSQDKISTKKLNHVQSIMNLYESGEGAQFSRGTLWGFVNAVTEYADFEKVVRGDESNKSKRLNSVWFGTGADLKQKAFNLALAQL